ncbi:MAG: UxaA family hydrolase, partial [Pirellulales bacterium]|nr:UxaA family hydrolase [Pirellulales bacterium]
MSNSAPHAVCLNADDNVCVAAKDLAAECVVEVGGCSVRLRQPIPMGHKVAVRAIASGDPVVKFGHTIGFATQSILPGDWVHTHNLAGRDFDRT